MQGLERLLELRGPAMSGDAADDRGWPSLQVYKGTRTLLLMLALFGKRPSTYSRPDSRAAIAADCPESEWPVQALYDSLAGCSVLTGECDSLRKLEPTRLDLSFPLERLQVLRESANELVTRLQHWRHTWDTNIVAHLADSTSSPSELGQSRQLNSASLFGAARFGVWSIPVTLILYRIATVYVLRLLISIPELRANVLSAGFRISHPSDDPRTAVDIYKAAVR